MAWILRKRIALLILPAMAFIMPITSGKDDVPAYAPSQREYYLDTNGLSELQPGLNVAIQKAEITPDFLAKVTVRITDDGKGALDLNGISTPGVVTLNFVLSRIKQGERQYTAYTSRLQPNATTGQLFLQANRDVGGTYGSAGDGVYTYTFATKVPSDYDPKVTHTVGIYATRDLTAVGLTVYVANAIFDWVPAGGPVVTVRDIVRTENCNICHDPLAHHGSNARREVRLCVLCHNPGTTDAVTGATADFKVLIHRIHRGADLPSVQAGGKFIFSTSDFTTVVFPRDIRNCDVCHQKGAQSTNNLTQPSRAACGSCHDNVDFSTGNNHGLGGVQTSDASCTLCHAPDTGREFDISVKGAHAIPEKSPQTPGVNIQIVSVDGTSPQSNPTVTFTLTDNKGNTLDASKMDDLTLALGGPTTDYSFSAKEDATKAVAGKSAYTYKFTAAIPAGSTGTFAVGAEAYLDVSLRKVDGTNVTARDAAATKVFYFGVTDNNPVKRRVVVTIDRCNVCHDKLSAHDQSRNNLEYCSICHRPNMTDEGGRPKDKMPAESLDLKNLIHKLHSGDQLANEYTLYDNGSPESLNSVRFPGDRRNCSKCHEGKSYQLPLLQKLMVTTTPRGFFTPTPPTAAACLACHDNQPAAAHAFVNIAPFGEDCATCHAEDAQFAVTRVHAR